MKKSFKILSLILICIMCFSLCGCEALDDLRESRAFLTEGETIKLPDGTEYKLLPQCEELFPNIDVTDTVYVSDEELPLLLTVFSQNSYSKSYDGIFLMDNNGENTYYCRTDVYNNIVERIDSGFEAEGYCYSYYDDDFNEMYYKLTESQAKAVTEVYNNQTPTTLPDIASMAYEYEVDLMLCSEDMLFMRDTVDICVKENKYYLIDYQLDTTSLYTVPDNLASEFEAIMKNYIESEVDFMEEW